LSYFEPEREGRMTEKKLNSVDAVKVSVRIMEAMAMAMAMALAQRAMGMTELAELLSETKPRVHRHRQHRQ
jgi:IclR family transcriptional regulator, KDG regulon repressor